MRMSVGGDVWRERSVNGAAILGRMRVSVGVMLGEKEVSAARQYWGE